MFKRKKNETKSEDKKYLKYKNGDLKEFNSEEELNAYTDEYEALNKNPTKLNIKSKLLIGLGMVMILAPLIMIFVVKGGDYIKEYKDYMVTGDSSQKEQIKDNPTPNNENKPIPEKPTSKKFTSEEIKEINSNFNKEMNKWYAYLKTDLVNYKKGTESVYSTQKNLEYKCNLANSILSKLVGSEADFIKNGAIELYNIYHKRIYNYTNGMNDMLKNLNRTNSVNIFNNILELDKKDSLLQETILEKYLTN